MKIGAISGLIAGFVAAIVYTIFAKIAVSLGFYPPNWQAIVPIAYGPNILLGIIFGIIGGVIYSKVYSIIPGKAVLKGLFFGLILYCILEVRLATFYISYAWLALVAGYIFNGFFRWIAYGLVLGFLYQFLRSRYYPTREETKIVTYDVKEGILPAAIAGLVGGMAAAFANPLSLAIGFYNFPGAPTAPTMDFLISQAGTHILINLIWGTIFGIVFARVYNVVPGKNVLKGIIFSMTMLLLTTFQAAAYLLAWGLSYSSAEFIFTALWYIFIAFFNAFFFGLVLGYLYKKE